MSAPLPRRSKGPSAIAAASAANARGLSGSEGDTGGRPERETPEAAPPPMPAAAVTFVAGLSGSVPVGAADDPAGAVPRPPAPVRRRLPRAVPAAGAAVAVAALIGGALLMTGGGDTRPSASAPGAAPGITHGGPYGSPPSVTGSASPSISPSASSSADRASASPKASAKGSATPGGAPTTAAAKSTATTAAGTQRSGTGSGSSGGGSSCVSTAGSGAITDHSACASSGTLTFQATFHASESFYHVFINTDGDTSTGYQLPYPSPSVLGADYMIENGGLYRSRSTGWSWTETAARPTMKVSGSTRTWTLSLSTLGSPAGTQRVEFNAGSDYTPVITFSPK
ncbi:hypothetical protein ACIBVL_35070 [Streptomyces sp. NPDC049687]|uniref:hypothetical protein n=1 Tax=Streptomyces sp. NPDC049687 TaxID=3365596 RepID=UPI00379F1214